MRAIHLTMFPALLIAIALSTGRSTLDASEVVSLGSDAKQPRVAVSGDAIAIAYAVGDAIDVATSTDGGATFSGPVQACTIPRLMAGMRRGPQLAMAGSSIVAAGIGSQDGDIVAWRSRDLGKTWSGGVVVNDRPKAAREGLFSLCAGKADTIYAVWLDQRDPGSRIELSVSTDGGTTWAPNTTVYQAPGGSVCECCQPTISADAGGALTVMWRNHLGEARDMWSCSSSNGGKTFTAPVKLGAGSWSINACPMDGGGVAVAGKTVQTIWRRDATLFTCMPGDQREVDLGPGKNGTIAIRGDTVYRAWQNRDGIAVAVGDRKPRAVGNGGYPQLACAADGKGPVMLVWEDAGKACALRVDE